MRSCLRRVFTIVEVLALLLPLSAAAQHDPKVFYVTFDRPAELPGETARPYTVIELDPATGVWRTVWDVAPAEAMGGWLDGMSLSAEGERFYTPSATVVLQGETLTRSGVVRIGPGGSASFLGQAAGISPGVDVDAFQVLRPETSNNMVALFSVDRPTTLGKVHVLASDIILYDQASGDFRINVRGTDVFGERAGAVNVDGLALLDDGSYLLSVDVPVEAGGVTATSCDLLRWDGSALTLYRNMVETDGVPYPDVEVTGLGTRYDLRLLRLDVEPAVVSTAGDVVFGAVIASGSSDPVVWARMQFESDPVQDLAHDSGCGTLCDGITWDGERYVLTRTVPAGASSTVTISMQNGENASAATAAGPSYVSEPGDANGDGSVNASDLARLIMELADDNGDSGIGSVRGGHVNDSWGGTDSNGDNVIDRTDLPVMTGYLF